MTWGLEYFLKNRFKYNKYIRRHFTPLYMSLAFHLLLAESRTHRLLAESGVLLFVEQALVKIQLYTGKAIE